MAITLLDIIGTITGKVAFERSQENFTALETEVNELRLLNNNSVPKADIIQTTEVNSSTKIPSSAVTYALKQDINSLNAQSSRNSVLCSATTNAELSILTNVAYRLDLITFTSFADSASSYLLIGNISITTIHEGTSSVAPRATLSVDNSKINITLNSYVDSLQTVMYLLTKINI